MKTISITVHLRVPDDVTPVEAGQSIFDTLGQYADDDLIESVDGWDPA